jgi:hypothetical protein
MEQNSIFKNRLVKILRSLLFYFLIDFRKIQKKFTFLQLSPKIKK